MNQSELEKLNEYLHENGVMATTSFDNEDLEAMSFEDGMKKASAVVASMQGTLKNLAQHSPKRRSVPS